MKSTPLIVPAYEMNHGLSIVIEPLVRVTVMSRSLKKTPVKRSRCNRTQQLSAPVTETKRCVTVQFVVDEAGGAFDVGVDGEEEELPPHAVKITAAVVIRMSLITWLPSRQSGHSRTRLRRVRKLVRAILLESSLESHMSVFAPVVLDVRAAFEAIPAVGLDTEFDGKVLRDGNPNTHIQGIAAQGDYLVLTHSDHSRKSGRLLVVRRQNGRQALTAEYCLPIVDQDEPFFFHAGGCQQFGQCLVVPAEASSSASVVLFLDVSDPLKVRELDAAARICRVKGAFAKKAGAVGITTFVHGGAPACLLAVHNRGEVDFYWTALNDFPRSFQFLSTAPVPQKEKEHQAFCLVTDTANRVYAIGLNRKALGEDKILLYEVDAEAGELTLVCERQLTTTGGKRFDTRPHFRWGGGLEVLSSTLVLSCTSHRYDDGCHINVFDSRLPVSREVVRPTTALRPRKESRAASQREKHSKTKTRRPTPSRKRHPDARRRNR